MTLVEKQNQIIEEFSVFDDWMDRYQYLVELGNSLPDFPDEYRIPQNIIEGCQSRVWLHAAYNDGVVEYQGDSDAVIVKGIVSLLLRVYGGCTVEEIVHGELFFIDQIGLKEHLSPTRSNGLVAMVKQMRLYALAFQAKHA